MKRSAAAVLVCGALAVLLAGCVPSRPFLDDQASAAVPTIALGARLLEENQPELAADAFSRLIAADGVSVEALVGLGAAYHRLGRPGEAVRVFQSAAELEPNSAEARNNLGVAYYVMGDYARSVSELERAFALTGGADQKVRFNLGVAEVALHRNAEEVEVDEADFDVIQYGNGVYRLKRRERDETTPPEQSEPETEARS